jgi:hypothetical protein
MLLAALKFAGVGWALLAGAAYAQESPQGLVAPSASESRLLEMLDEAVAYLSERLPFQLDFSTRLIGVRRDGRTLVYQYQVERVSRRALQGHATALGRRTCNNRQLFNLMTIGGAVRYSYELKESGQQVVHEITLDHCGAREITL